MVDKCNLVAIGVIFTICSMILLGAFDDEDDYEDDNEDWPEDEDWPDEDDSFWGDNSPP